MSDELSPAGSKKCKLREIFVAVLHLEDGSDARTVTVSVEVLGDLIEQALLVCRERESLNNFDGDPISERMKYRPFMQALEQMHEGLVKAGVMSVMTDEDEEDDDEEKS